MAAYGNDDDWNNDIPDGSGESDREPLTGPTPTNLTSHRRASARWLSNHSGEVAIVCGTLSYAFHGISTEELQKKGSFPSLQVIAVRSTIGSMLTFIAIVIVHGRPESLHSIKHAITGPCDRSRRLLLTTRALLGAIASYTNYEAIKRLPLGASNALFYCYPICVTLLSWPILRERIGWLESISVLVGIGGTLLIAQPPTLFGRDDDTGDDGPSTTERAIGVAMQLLTATTFASAVVLVRYLRESTGVLTLSLWYHVASTTLALLLLLCGIQNPLPPNSPTVTGFSFLLGITSFLGQVFISTGYQRCTKVIVAAGLAYLEVAYSFLCGLAFFNEKGGAISIVGALVIVFSGMTSSIAARGRSDFHDSDTSDTRARRNRKDDHEGEVQV